MKVQKNLKLENLEFMIQCPTYNYTTNCAIKIVNKKLDSPYILLNYLKYLKQNYGFILL